MKISVMTTKLEMKVLSMVKKTDLMKQVTQLASIECRQNQKSLFCSFFSGKHFIKFLIMEC